MHVKEIHIKEKVNCKLAVLLEDQIQFNGWIYYTAAMIPHMGHLKNITVFTNSITVAHEILNSQQHIKVYMIGGILHPHHESTLSIDCFNLFKQIAC